MTVRRLRRLRQSENLRRLVAETRLDPSRLVLPIFVSDEAQQETPLEALPGHFHWPSARVGLLAKQAESLGIPGVLVFGVTDRKDPGASQAFAADGPAQRAIAEIKSSAPGMVVFADTCLCGYTDTGHCGLVQGEKVLNDASVEVIARTAVSQAEAGADFVAPSDMMDGRVAAIRAALDGAGFADTGILSYAAKFASSMYGPFRAVASSAPAFGDRRSYQIDPASGRQGIAGIARDLEEGADMVMVKPALVNLDLIAEARKRFDVPLSAYNVSGEYAMVKAAAERGWMDERRAALEILGSMVRAGADFVITYHALEAARWMGEG
ncbi:MAG TPA: porphobilinogen synthase [Actinomycetota bacterium]|nr:porphobilinogen synthase [Actinomycetota bacterium]